MKPNQIITYYVRDEKKPLKRFTPLWLNDNRKWECYDESDVTLMKWCKRRKYQRAKVASAIQTDTAGHKRKILSCRIQKQQTTSKMVCGKKCGNGIQCGHT